MPKAYSEFIKVNKNGHLEVEDCDCVELARRDGTPLYVMSESQLRYNYQAFYNAFAKRYPKIWVACGVKANNNIAVRKVLAQEGAGADCFGLGEMYVALAAGTSPEKIFLNGSNKSYEELEAAIRAGVTINVDNPEELEMVKSMAARVDRTARVLLRIKPPLLPLEEQYMTDYRYLPPQISIGKWAREHKFGMDLETSATAARRALGMKHVRLVGLHYHLKGQTTHTDLYQAMTAEVMDFVGRLRQELEWEPEELDLGGGFGVGRLEGFGPGGQDKHAPPIDEFAEVIVRTVRQKLTEYSLSSEPTLTFEPGRWPVNNAGLLLGTVGVVKEWPGVKKWAHVDASTNHIMRVQTANYYYHIVVANKADQEPTEVVDVVGPLCNAADILGADRKLPPLERGDIIAVLDTGGYAESASCTFNTYPRPATVLVSGDRSDIIAERETILDIITRQAIPPRLFALDVA
jgi:diaminopimelate decarboxylase